MEAVLVTQLNILRLFDMKPNFSELARYYGVDRRTVKKYYDGYEGKPKTRNKASMLDQYYDLIRTIRGWVNYFALADMKQLLRSTDEWLRRKIRAVYWKQWKKIKTRYRMIKKFGLPEWKVHELANCRKGIWRSAIALNSVLTNKVIASLGYMSMADYYLKICEN